MSASKLSVQLRATLQPQDFNVEGLTRRQFAVRRGFHYESGLSFPPSQVDWCPLVVLYVYDEILGSQTSDLWTDAAVVRRVREKRERERETERQRDRERERERVSRRKIREEKESETERISKWATGREVAKRCVFPMFCGSGGPKKYEKVGSLKQRSGRMRDQKLHAPVARSKSGSQNGKTTSASEHFWSCSKSARGCCAKRSSTKRDIKSMFCSRGIHWSKKCTVDHTVWCKARFEVKKMVKTPHVCTVFGSCVVEKVHAAMAQNTFRSQKR